MFSALLEEVGGLVSQVIFDEHLSTLRGPAQSHGRARNTSASINSLAVDLKCQHLAISVEKSHGGQI